jgi:hypothetical protein
MNLSGVATKTLLITLRMACAGWAWCVAIVAAEIYCDAPRGGS